MLVSGASNASKNGGMEMKSKMDKKEFDAECKKLGYTSILDLCIDMGNFARIAIDPDHVRTQLDRFGCLSRYQTASFRLFFRLVKEQHEYA